MDNKGSVMIYKILAVAIFLTLSLIIAVSTMNIVEEMKINYLQNNMRVRVNEVVGIINALQVSYPDTRINYTLPDENCTLNIEKTYVKMDISFKNMYDFYQLGYFQTDVPVKPQLIECDIEKKKSFFFVRNKQGIFIEEIENRVGDDS